MIPGIALIVPLLAPFPGTQQDTPPARPDYAWSSVPDGSFRARNRAQALLGRVGPDGLEVCPLAAPLAGSAGAPWHLALETVAFGREGDVRALGQSTLAGREGRVERRFDGLVEWAVNDARGIEQGWTIPAPPPGLEPSALAIELEARGLEPRIAEDGLSAVLLDGASAVRLHYEGLIAFDADGRELDARLVRTAAGFALRVAAQGARYPVTVDPILRGPVWTADGVQGGASLGSSLAAAGDVNGDGFGDVIIGVPGYTNGQAGEGQARVYLGTATGLSSAASWEQEPDRKYAQYGWWVSGAGDVNGDGFDDVLVATPTFPLPGGPVGRAFLYLGSVNGPSVQADWTIEGSEPHSAGRFTAVGAGDVNGDGFDDVLVGDPDHTSSGGNRLAGRAMLYLGSASGPSATPDWMVESFQHLGYFGFSVAGAGDVDGDGYDDVLVGMPRWGDGTYSGGAAFLYLGSASGLGSTPGWQSKGLQQPLAFSGGAVSGAGDVNGDGYDDVLVAAPWFEGDHEWEGRADLYLGSPSGPSPGPDWKIKGGQPWAYLGTSVAGVGDVNGDSLDDILVGAPGFSDDFDEEGRASLYLGTTSGPSPIANWAMNGGQNKAQLSAVDGAGDANADGFADVIVGMPGFANPDPYEGRALLFLGQAILDCNANGNDDTDDIASGTSEDCDQDGVPDECQPDADGDGTPDVCELGVGYCGPAVLNSSGLPGVMDASGSRVVTDNALTLEARQLPPNQFGFFLVSDTQAFISNPGGSQGNLCLGGTIGRYAKDVASTGSLGELELLIDLAQLPPPLNQAVLPGETWNFQAWFRDKNPTPTSNFTDGFSILFL